MREITMATERIIAWDRKETDSCQASTPGCAINHTAEREAWFEKARALGLDHHEASIIDSSCDTW